MDSSTLSNLGGIVMTYGECKKQILALIEEYAPNTDNYTEDEDIATRIPFWLI